MLHYYVNLMAYEARWSSHEDIIYYQPLCIEIRLIDFYSRHYSVNNQMLNLTRVCPNLDEMKSTFGKQDPKAQFPLNVLQILWLTQIQETLHIT